MALPALADEHSAAAPLLLCAGACCRARVLRRAAIDRYPLYIPRAPHLSSKPAAAACES